MEDNFKLAHTSMQEELEKLKLRLVQSDLGPGGTTFIQSNKGVSPGGTCGGTSYTPNTINGKQVLNLKAAN